jgi:3'-phosphoadenosine 5'-phosphosulfate sulfotransferase (PAPS reductase)/FAD synthetase
MQSQPEKTYALFSGGHDSLVSAHTAMTSGTASTVLHIDTGIGIPQTQEFVKDTCARHGWELEIVGSDFEYDEIVKEHGFPGPGVHIIMYSKLKERALRKVARRHDDKPRFVTGVRKQESDRRFRNVEPETEAASWIWAANIHEMTKDDVEAYIDEHDLQRSSVKQQYHHSGSVCAAHLAIAQRS